MASETALWNWLRERLPPQGRYSRIESETAPGFPDVDYTIEGKTGRIELKESRYPTAKHPFKKGGLRDSQIAWILDEEEAGGKRCYIIAGVDRLIFVLDAFKVLEKFNIFTLEDLRGHALLVRHRGKPIDEELLTHELERILTTE